LSGNLPPGAHLLERLPGCRELCQAFDKNSISAAQKDTLFAGFQLNGDRLAIGVIGDMLEQYLIKVTGQITLL
jgi:hypothetical protein